MCQGTCGGFRSDAHGIRRPGFGIYIREGGSGVQGITAGSARVGSRPGVDVGCEAVVFSPQFGPRAFV